MSRSFGDDDEQPSEDVAARVPPAAAMPADLDDQTQSQMERAAEAPENDLGAARLAHDLGNYLQVVGSALNLIDRQTQGSSTTVLAQAVIGARYALCRASSLCRALSKPDDPEPAAVMVTSFRHILRELAEMIILIVGPAIEVRFLCSDDGPSALCDRRGFEDCVLNLVTNAKYAMPDGGVLTLEAYREIYQAAGELVPGPSSAVLCISDTGCGIEQDALERVFRARFTTKTQGSGLGLTNVRDFICRAGGAVEVRSVVGNGTGVILRLPEWTGGLDGET